LSKTGAAVRFDGTARSVDDFESVASIARALGTLGRTRATGTLDVTSGGWRRARIAIVDGVVRAISLPNGSTPLGDMLGALGAIDTPAYLRALEQETPARPIGAWLVRHGTASEPAVSYALRRQLRDRLLSIMGWGATELRFSVGLTDIGQAHVDEPPPMADLVLGAVRRLTAGLPAHQVRRRLGGRRLGLTKRGRTIIAEAPLFPHERAMCAALGMGVAVDTCLAVGGNTVRAASSLYALSVVGAVADPSTAHGVCSLLVRKRRQLQRRARAEELLDLPSPRAPVPRAPEVRRALRRLARDVHPDRFAHDDVALQRTSAEIMSALLDAERTLTGR
jgi:hypothetical protein